MPNEITMSYGKRHHIEQLQFHSDWNWITEVLDAIEKVADWTLECLNYSDGNRNYQMMIPLSNTNVIFKDKKEAVVQAINQFLIWYENNIKEWWQTQKYSIIKMNLFLF